MISFKIYLHTHQSCNSILSGAQLQEFCQFGTKEECLKLNQASQPCTKLHFRKIIHKHTDGSFCIFFWSFHFDFFLCISVCTVSLIGRASDLVYTEFILFRLCRKLFSLYRNTLESVPGTNQYWAISLKFPAEGNNGLSLTGFEPMRLAILRLLVRRINLSTTSPPSEL